jgi:Ras-related protein Rab-21
MAAASSNAQDAGRSQPLNFKVVLLGEGAVGKTSLVVRYVDNKFNDKHISTLQASFLTKNINIAGRRLTLSIWDTAGQERFHALGPIYYRDSNGAILVYDITDEDSFQKVKVWVKELRKMLGNDIALCIVGNKTDLDKDRHVTVDEAESYSATVGAKHFNTSAKLNKGLDELFLDLSRRMIERVDEEALTSRGMTRSASSRRNVVTIVDEDQQRESSSSARSGCCGGGGGDS